MLKHKALILAAVIVMLAAATTAQAYNETWYGWFSSGTLYYGMNSYVKAVDTAGTASDSTIGSRDTFYTNYGGGAMSWIPFVCSSIDDTIYLTISDGTGGKDTGQSGQKDGNGVWSGSAVRRKNSVETIWTSVSGTWDTGTRYDSEYFNYVPNPDTYYGGWDVTSSTPSGLTGSGYSNGGRQ